LLELQELARHGGVIFGEFFDGHFLRFVIGETQIFIRAQQRFFGFLQVID
jgi:hypothetical protein